MKNLIRLSFFLLILSMLFFACGQGSAELPESGGQSSQPDKQAPAPKQVEPGPKIPMELWIMSQCPYGTGAENAVKNLMDVLGPRIDLAVRFVLDQKEDGSFKSLHGDAEVELDMVQACVGILAPEKMLDFIVADNKSPEPWQKDAAEMGLDVAAIEKCMGDGSGAMHLAKDSAEGNAKGATASPTIFIAGKEYDGSRGSLDLFEAICAKLDDKPAACDNPPQTLSRTDAGAGSGSCGGGQPAVPDELIDQTAFVHTVLYDANAFTSYMDRIISQTKQYFPNIKIEKVDVNSDQGKKLVAQYGVDWVPAYVFPESVKNLKNFPQLEPALKKTKDGKSFILDPAKIGANVSLSRNRVPGHLKVFYSPYALDGLTLMLELFDLLKTPEFSKVKVDFIPRVMIDQKGQIVGRGGTAEVEEAARHDAVIKLAPEKLRAYIEARRENPLSSYWEDFVTKIGLDPALVKKTALSDEIMSKLLADAKMADAVHANPSFTVLVENRELAEVSDKAGLKKLLESMAK